MTDNEIILALECCEKNNVCNECPLGCRDIENCIELLAESALDLISRQKAEIERLKAENQKLKHEMSYMKNPNSIGDIHEMGAW